MTKTILSALALLSLVGLGGRAIYQAMLTEDERIRQLFAAEVEAFNSGSRYSVMDGFALEYRETSSGLTRSKLRGAVLYVLTKMHAQDGGLPFRVTVPDEDVRVDLDAAAETARVTAALYLYQTKKGEETLRWEVEIEAELLRGDSGWLIVKSSHVTKQGTQPR